MATPSIRRPDLPAGLSYEKPDPATAAPTTGVATVQRPALPDGLSYERPTPAVAAPTLKQPRSWARAAGDLGVGLLEGGVSAGLAIPQLANTLTGGAIDEAWKPLTGAVDRLAGGPGEGRTLAQSSQDTRAALDELKSPQLRAAEQDLANTKGFLPSAKAILTNPMLLGQQVAEQVPQFIVPAGAARKVGASVLEKVGAEALAKGTAKRVAAGLGEQEAAQLALPAANRLAQRAASKAAGRAVMATGGAIGASQASEQAQQEVMGLDQSVMDANPEYRQMRAQGLSDADARQKLAITAGMKAAAIALPFDTLTSGLSARLEGNIFRGQTGVQGLSQLLSKRGAAGVAKAAGKEGAEETLQEGGEQFAQNVGVQGVDPNKSLMDQVPEQAALGGTIGAVLGAGGFAGSSALSRPSAHAAPPGSLTDAANVLSQPANGPIGRAAQEGVANGAVAAAAQAANPPAEAPSAQSTRVDPGVAPWADPTTGELANPSPADLIRALADHMVAQHQATGDMRINAQQIAEAWGVPKGAVERTRKAATTMASDQLAAAERAAMAPPAAAPAEPEPGTTASIPFMITQQMRADLRALGHTDAEIAGMTPEQANTLLQAGQSVATAPQETTDDERVPEPAPAAPAGAGAEAARAADEQPAAGGEPQQPAGSGAATQPAPDSPAAVAGERAATDANPTLTPPSKEAPADAETPASAAPAPGLGGNPAAVAGEGGEPAAGAAETGAPAAAAEAPAEPKAKVTRAPKAPKGRAAAPANHVHAAIQRIAEGEHPEKVLAEADEATVRAVGAAMGKRFSTKAPLGAMVERIGETAASDRRRLAADALVKMGRQKAAEAPPLQPVPSPAPRSTQSVAARKAESLRVKTPTGEVNGRSHVDHLIKDGYTHLTSTRAGDKLVHSLAKADGTSEKIHARQLAYAQERLAVPAEQPAAAPAPATADKRQQIEKGFAENKAAIVKHMFKAGDTVTFTQNGKTITGTIAKGDKAGMVKDMGVFEVEHPGRGGKARTTIGARRLTRAEVAPTPAAPTTEKSSTVAPALDRAALRDTFAAAFKKHHPTQAIGREFLDKNADEVVDAIERKDGRALVSRNLGSAEAMPAARAVFEAATGIKLPKGRRASEDAIYRWAGSSYEAEQARKADAKKAAADKKREPVEKFPEFTDYRAAESWVRRRAEAFGGVKKYAQTEEYRRLLPTLRELAEAHNNNVRSSQAEAMAAVGVKEGDTVESSRRGMQTKHGWVDRARGKVFMKDGAPWVRLEDGATVRHPGQTGNRRAVPWSKEWLPVGSREAPTEYQKQQARDANDVSDELEARAAALDAKIGALTDDQARAGLVAIGEDKPKDLRDPKETLRQQHPDDIEAALKAAVEAAKPPQTPPASEQAPAKDIPVPAASDSRAKNARTAESAVTDALRSVANEVEKLGTNNGQRALDARWAAGAIKRLSAANGVVKGLMAGKQTGALAVAKIGMAKAKTPDDVRRVADKLEMADKVEAAASEAASHPDNGKPEPTPAQKEAGNYEKGHVSVQGLDISIENPRGSTRSGVGENGKPWSHVMTDHYGYIRRTEGADGEQVDVYVGPNPASDHVYVVDQLDQKTGGFDEHKAMIGFDSETEAVKAYRGNFDKGWKVGPVHAMSMDEFKAWLKDGDTTRPAGERETAPAPETPPPGGVSASADAGTLDDFGERLEGARKFMPPSLKETLGDEQIASQPLSKFWPADAYKSIEDPASAALAFAARAAVPAKPRVAYKVKRWVEQVKTLRGLLGQTHDAQSMAAMEELARKVGSRLEGFFAKVRLLAQLPRESWGRVDRVGEYPDARKLKTDDELKADGFIRVHDPKTGNDYYRMDPKTGEKTGPRIVAWGDTAAAHDSLFKTTPFSSVTIDGKTHTFDGAGQIGPDEVQQVKSLLVGESPKQAAALTKADFEIRSYRSRQETFINRKGDPEKRALKTFTGPDALKEARAWRDANVPALEKAWEAVKARDNVSKADTRRKENRAREGVDRRNGKDVTPAMFEQALGFRGVQFGNWVGQGKGAKDRQGMLNEAYDALLDLADLLGIPSRAISLNGSLGLALGARGAGRNNAHFEPSNLVINLTKTKGAGSLAHEWFHALDNYFSRLRGGEVPFNGNQDDYRRNNFITYKPEPAWVHRGDMARAGTRTSADLRTTLQQRGMWKEGQTLEQNAEAAGWQRDPAHKQGVRPEVERAFADLVQALNDSPMAARVRRLDKSADGYWHRIIERGARSFENYVISKLALNGQSNDFLANVADWKAWAERGKNMDRYPYLKPEEEAPVVAAFDKLFDTVQTREDDAGNVALFSIDVDGNESTGRAATTFAEARKAAADFVGHPITNDNGLVPATVSHTTLGKMLSDSAVRKSTSLADHVRAVANLDTLYRTGMLDRTHADSRGEPTIAAIHRVVAPMVGVNGEVLAVKMTVKETTHPNTPNPLYSVETLQVDPVEEGKPARKAPQSGGERAPGQDRNAPQAGFSADVTRMLQEFKDRLFRRVSGEDIPAPSTTAQAEHTARIEQLATAALAKWQGDDVPRLRVVDTPEQLPAGARFDADGNPSNAYRSAAGMYDGRTIWIVASRHTTDRAGLRKLLTTMAHEGVGHYGMDRIVDRELGAGAWKKIEDAADRLRQNPDKASPAIRAVLAELDKRYHDADRKTYAREFMAVTAERGVKNGLLDRVVSAIRRWLRRVLPDLRLSEHELRQLVVASDQYLRIGETQQQRVQSRAALAFSQAADPTTTAAFKRFFGDWERLARPGSYESPGALARPLGETPITGLDAVVRRDLQRVNPDEVSKVVDAAGNPLVLYHGTAEDFSVFGHDRAGEATGHATSPLGHFFTPDRAQAAGYARNASEGRPADERVVDAYVAIRNPYTMSLKQAQAIETPAQARALRAKLEAEGYDGIRLPEQNAWVAFHSEQIKSASGNRGTFDASTGNIYFSRDTDDRGEQQEPGAAPQPFSHATESTQHLDDAVSTAQDSMFQKAKDWMRGKYEDFVPAMLGAVQRRFLTELMAGHKALRGAKQYDEDVQALNATRQQLLAGAPDAAEHPDDMLKHGAAAIADDLRAYAHVKGPGGWLGAKTEQGRVLAGVMHDSTILGIDPSEPYEPLKMQNSRGEWVTWTPALVKQRIAVLKEVMLGRPGDDKRAMMEEIKTLRSLKFREKERTKAYPALVARYEALPAKGKQLFQQVRDWHAQYSDALQEALEARIAALRGDLKKGDPELAEKHLRMLTHKLRAEFEASRVQGIYFPLNRDGDFWVSYTDKTGAQGFQMFESAAAQERFVKDTRRAGGKVVVQGRRSEKGMAKDAPPGTLIAEVIGTLKESGVADSIQDDIYQLFLRTLPEMSMRKHAIHRKATPGFSDDITRGFAKNAFHGAHQLARLQYAHRLQSTIDQLQENMDAFRANPDAGSLEVSRGDALLAELKKRHQYLMSPTDSQLANMANSIGFLWFLGASPASALVNLTQNAQVTLPVLGAHHGWPKAMKELGRAVRDSMKTGGNIHRTLKDPDELRAYNMLRARGDIDKTRSHDLAGLSEGSLIQTNPVWARVMAGMTWLFHKAEVVNRESAGMAAYRLARQRGDDFTAAVQYASDIINGTHFDYSADNRPRYMQGNTARVALQFKNYSVSMTTLLYRNLYQAFKGETPEVRRMARRTLTGVLGMTGLLAGAIGLPIINVMRFAAGAAHAAFGDDDEPWDFDTEFRNWLAEHFGDTAAGWIADGVVSHATGVNIAGRVSLSDMWFRDSDRELEGKDQYYALMDSLLGPLAGAAKNLFIGSKMIGDGHTLRGIETMLPSFAKNAMKGYRYASQGVNSLAGAPIVSDVSGAEAFAQLIGLQPESVAEQYRINSAKKAYGDFIVHRRTSIRNAYAMAVEQRDGAARRAAQDKMVAFNRRWPIAAIRPSDIRASLRGRARARTEENGINLPRRLRSTLEQMVNPTAQ